MHISALGIINNLGASKEEVWKNTIVGNRTRLVSMPLENKTIYVGKVNEKLPQIPQEKYNLRVNQLLLHCFQQIENEWISLKYSLSRIGIVLGSNNLGLEQFEQAFGDYFKTGVLAENLFPQWLECNVMIEFMRFITKATGPSYAISTACSSSAKVFAVARNLINNGLCDAVLVGGSDDLCNFTIKGFNALGAYAHEKTNPFCKNRDGINIGEGAALFLITRAEGEVNLIGVGESSDTYHVTSPDPSGKGAILSMSRALQDAKLHPQQIDYINLHGTGTLQNDDMEAKAINQVFGSNVICSSSKALTGHLLGAAGATEIGLCWLMMSSAFNKSQMVIPHCMEGEAMVESPMLCQLGDKKRIQYCLSNSFAFGGSNASVVLGKLAL